MTTSFRKVESPKRDRSPVPALHTPHSTLLKPPAACLPPPTPRKPRARPWTLKRCTETVCTFFRGAYHSFGTNIIVFLTLLVIVMVGYPLQSIQNKMQPPKEMTEMKKIVEVMKKKVKNAEAACLNVEDELCCMHLGIQDHSTDTADIHSLSFCSGYSDAVTSEDTRPDHTDHTDQTNHTDHTAYIREVLYPGHLANSCKEVAIMSYLYTDSFNAIRVGDDDKNN
ncbi:hypothetical protein JYU34_012395 [Plutella xylostella]|uniref:Uncharacterized protein n=1 Tax=Plutella xylostella TaxID=51655 RepID=A0ABQ7QBH7_PLUXY|nr:hypothetical protein JYU34_012395 [Plutella xylostella]